MQGLAGSFVVKLVGSYTNVVGLPLYETAALLAGEGYDIHKGWAAAPVSCARRSLSRLRGSQNVPPGPTSRGS